MDGITASGIVGVGAAALLLAGCGGGNGGDSQTRASLASASDDGELAARLPTCDISAPGFSMTALQHGEMPTHTEDDVRAVISRTHVGPQQVTQVAPAMVTDPTGVKLGLPTTARIMWVVYGRDIYEIPTEGPPPQPGVTAGTVFHSLWLVDDETLKNGGGFACGQ